MVLPVDWIGTSSIMAAMAVILKKIVSAPSYQVIVSDIGIGPSLKPIVPQTRLQAW